MRDQSRFISSTRNNTISLYSVRCKRRPPFSRGFGFSFARMANKKKKFNGKLSPKILIQRHSCRRELKFYSIAQWELGPTKVGLIPCLTGAYGSQGTSRTDTKDINSMNIIYSSIKLLLNAKGRSESLIHHFYTHMNHRIIGVNNLIPDRSDFTNFGSMCSDGCCLSIQTKVDSTLYPADSIGSIHPDQNVV